MNISIVVVVLAVWLLFLLLFCISYFLFSVAVAIVAVVGGARALVCLSVSWFVCLFVCLLVGCWLSLVVVGCCVVSIVAAVTLSLLCYSAHITICFCTRNSLSDFQSQKRPENM